MAFLKFKLKTSTAIYLIATTVITTYATSTLAQINQCTAESGATITPVVELYTSEGCSSCPPADKWASSLKDKGFVVQAFHVGYWDYIGWVDRFAAPANTVRQREVAQKNKLRNIYTPQAVLNGQDWPQWSAGNSLANGGEAARAHVVLTQRGLNQFEANVTRLPVLPAATSWSAYWTITEHGHNSRVQAGENAGEFLKHDFVVRQYTQAGEYKTAGNTPQKLIFNSIPSTPGHLRQVNLVIFDTKSGHTLQAVSLQCAG